MWVDVREREVTQGDEVREEGKILRSNRGGDPGHATMVGGGREGGRAINRRKECDGNNYQITFQ